MKKRILSILLACSMIMALIPSVLTPTSAVAAEAAEAADQDVDAFGIVMDNELSEEESEKTNNPYGTDNWFPLFTVNELFMAKGHENGRTFNTYNYNENGKVGDINKVTDGYSVGAKSERNKDGFTMMDTAPCDPTGSGQDRYAAVLAYEKGTSNMKLYLADQKGNRVSQTVEIGNEDTLEYLETVDSYNYTGFISVTAGDFDGDGKDSIVVYVPEMEEKGKQPYILEYSISDNLQINTKGTWVKNVYDLTGTGNLSQRDHTNSKVRNNTPLVQLIASDTDNDNRDELVITTSMNNCSANDVEARESRLFIYDLHKNNSKQWWQQTYWKTTKNYAGGMNGAKRLRWASSSVGNVIQASSGTDYPEIVTAGWIDKSDEDSTSLTNNIGSYITKCNGTSVTKDDETPIGSYQSDSVAHLSTNDNVVSEFTSGGHYSKDDCQALLPVAVFLSEGVKNKADILISDTVYKYNGTAFEKRYREKYFNDDDDGINGYLITNGLVIDAVVGNFDGNTVGREQVIFSTVQKQSSKNNYFVNTYTYQTNGTSWESDETGYITYHEGDAYISLSALDVDDDSTIVQIKNITKTYTEPEVLALLEATPYFMEIDGGDTGNGETTYGTSKTVTEGKTTSNGMTTNILAGFEWAVDDVCNGFVCGAGVEATVEMGWTWETTEETSVTYELSYANDTGENAVIVYRRPVLAYEYEVKNSGATMVLVKEGTLASNMITLDEYNAVASQYGMNPIADGILCEPGNPFSYHNSTVGLYGAVTSEQVGNYKGNGTMTQSFSNEQSEAKTFTYDMNTSVTAYGMVFGAKFGGGGGFTTSVSNSTINTTEITKSGTVTSKNVDGYDFQWRFAHWTTAVNDTLIPVLGYVLEQVQAPPSPPTNLQANNITANGATISWEASVRPADEYRIYQYFETTQTYIQVATVDGTETSCNISDLQPNSTYRYVIRAYSVPPGGQVANVESVDSEQLAFTTAPKDVSPITIVSPKDANVRVGGTASFAVEVTLPNDQYKTITYQWQSRSGTAGWTDLNGETNSTLTIKDVQQDLNGSQYRCKLIALYLGSPIVYYSDASKLTVGRATLNVELQVENAQSVNGDKDNPYVGRSDYRVQSGTSTSEVMTTENVTVNHEGSNLVVYKDKGGNYFGYDPKGDTYYRLNKTSEESDEFAVTSNIKLEVSKTYDGINETVIPQEGLNGFDSDKQKYMEENGKSYFLKAEVVTPNYQKPLGEGKDETRLAGLSGMKYYWQSGNKYYSYVENDGIGAEATIDAAVADSLYDVYVKDNNVVVLGREETWTVTSDSEEADAKEIGYWYDYITVESNEGSLSYTVTPFTEETSTSYPSDFNPTDLSVYTKDVKETQTTPIYTTKKGDRLKLKVTLAEDDNIGNPITNDTKVNLRIINTETAAVTTLSTKVGTLSYATFEWSAPTAGLYSIQAVVQPDDNYIGTQSTVKYYDAHGDDKEEYRLFLSETDTALTGSMPYGGTVTPILQKRTVEEGKPGQWTSYEGECFFTVIPASGSESDLQKTGGITTYHPQKAGMYTFRAYSSNTKDPLYQLASATLEVTRISTEITPSWTDVPASASDVTLTATPALLDHDTDLKKIFDINSAYFSEKHNSYGRYKVTISYKTDEDAIKAVADFRNNYMATLGSKEFVIKPNSAKVNFSCGENGSISGRAGDNLSIANPGQSQINGTKLTFQATPNSGYAVDEWKVNGESYGVSDVLPNWLSLSEDRQKLIISSFNTDDDAGQLIEDSGTKALNIFVTFRNANNIITYGIGNSDGAGTSGISAEVSDTDSQGQKLNPGTPVALGSRVIITAKPAQGYVVDYWLVNNKTYCRADGSTTYRGETLTLDDVQAQYTVLVYFKQDADTFEVKTVVCDEKEKENATLATITAANADTGDEITKEMLSALRDGTSIVFTANLNTSFNNTVKEWQTSTDGTNFTTVAGSGGQKTLTLYNLTSKTHVRAIVTTAQTYSLNYQVKMGETPITDSSIAQLAAVSGEQQLITGEEQSAYIPVDFKLTLNPDYYIVDWSDNVIWDSNKPLEATLSSLTEDTTVTVNISQKPKVTITSPSNGSLEIRGTVNGQADTDISKGGYVDSGSTIVVTLKPENGYEVDPDTDTAGLAYTDGSGDTTDNKTYTIENVNNDLTIGHTFTKLPSYNIGYSVVDTDNDGHGNFGTLIANVERKNMSSYETENESDESGNMLVYRDGTIVLTATATESGYRVKEWKINDNVYKGNTGVYTDNRLALTSEMIEELQKNADEPLNISVQFESGDPYITFVNPDHGVLSATVAGGKFTSGGTSKLPVTFTVTPDEHYEVKSWKVDGDSITGQTGTTFEFSPQGSNATIAVDLQGKTLDIIAKAENENSGSVSVQPQNVRYGDNVKLLATPSKGYAFEGWYHNNTKIEDAGAEYSFDAYNDGTYQARFIASAENIVNFSVKDPEMGTITAETGDGSTVNTGDKLSGGQKLIFTVNPKSGYRVKSWNDVVDSISDDKTTATVDALSGNLTVEVTLEKIPTHTITLIETTNGSVSAQVDGEDVTTVPDGTVVTFKALPDPYWMLDTWTGDVGSNKTSNIITLTVTDDINVGATFKGAVNYNVYYKVDGENGTVSGTADEKGISEKTEVQVVGGSKLIFKASPSKNYMVKAWTLKVGDKTVDVSENLSETLTINALDGNTNVTVSYEPLVEYEIPKGLADTYNVDNVQTTPEWEHDGYIRKGGDLRFTVTPVDGKVITALQVEGGNVERDVSGAWTVTIENIASEIELNPTVSSGIPLIIGECEHGTVTVNHNSTSLNSGEVVRVGDELTITVKPDSGYTLKVLKVNDNPFTSGSTYTITNDDKVVKIVADFRISGGGGGGGGGGSATSSKHKITLENTTHGSVIASVSKAAKGDKVTLVMAPDDGYVVDVVTAVDQSGNTLSLTQEDGKYTFKMPSSNVTVKASFVTSFEPSFTHIKLDNYYYNALFWAALHDITTSTSDGVFNPVLTCTRVKATNFLWPFYGAQ